jgi:hypothetical protein
MKTEGLLEPETRERVQERYDGLASAADEMVRAATQAMAFDTEEYDERVTDEVRAAAQQALFASLLAVRVGTRAEYERWRESHEGELVEIGNDNATNVVWHDPSWTDDAVAATFRNERGAAVATLRKHAFGHLYSEVIR